MRNLVNKLCHLGAAPAAARATVYRSSVVWIPSLPVWAIRSEGDYPSPSGPSLETANNPWSDSNDIPTPQVDDLVVQLRAAGAAHDEIRLFLLAVAVAREP